MAILRSALAFLQWPGLAAHPGKPYKTGQAAWRPSLIPHLPSAGGKCEPLGDCIKNAWASKSRSSNHRDPRLIPYGQPGLDVIAIPRGPACSHPTPKSGKSHNEENLLPLQVAWQNDCSKRYQNMEGDIREVKHPEANEHAMRRCDTRSNSMSPTVSTPIISITPALN